MKTFRLLGGVLFALGIALSLPAAMRHADERSEWREARLELSTSEYDAVQSDILYRRSEETRREAERGALLLVVGLLVMLAAWDPRGVAELPLHPPIVTLVDGLLGAALFLMAYFGDPLGLWDSSESALGAALEASAPLLLLLPHAPLAAGRSLGLRAAAGGLPAGRSVRLRAALLGSFALPVLVLTFWALGRFSSLGAIHLPSVPKPEKQDRAVI